MAYRDRVSRTVTRITGRSAALAAWPVDSIFFGYTSTSPATLLGGGTWTQIALGRMLIGQNPSDATMDAVGDMGGSKTHVIDADNMDVHVHSMTHTHTQQMRPSAGSQAPNVAGGGGAATPDQNNAINSYVGNTTDGGSQLHQTPVDHMNPYLTVYIWRRTA